MRLRFMSFFDFHDSGVGGGVLLAMAGVFPVH